MSRMVPTNMATTAVGKEKEDKGAGEREGDRMMAEGFWITYSNTY
jgi:hypothetical protein